MSKLFTAALVLLPAVANAQGYEGAVVDLQYQTYEDSSGFDFDRLEGTMDASWRFGGFGVQAGLTLGKVLNNSADLDFNQYNAVAVHLTTDVSDALRLGVMAAADNNADEIYLYAAEAIYLSGPLRVEGRIGDSLDTEDYTLVDVKGSYAIGNAFSAKMGLLHEDYGTAGYYQVLSIGAGYKVSPGTEVYAGIGRHKNNDPGALIPTVDGNILNLGVRFDLGGSGSDKMFSYQPLH